MPFDVEENKFFKIFKAKYCMWLLCKYVLGTKSFDQTLMATIVSISNGNVILDVFFLHSAFINSQAI